MNLNSNFSAAVVVNEPSRFEVTRAISSTASSKAAWLAADGFAVPLTLRTY